MAAERRSKLDRLEAVAAKVPQYPGRKTAEAIARPLVRPWAQRVSTQLVRSAVGYWVLWQATPGGRAGIVDRGWMGRRAAYQAEADFRRVFGVPVEEFSLDQFPAFLFGDEAGTSPGEQ